MGFSPNGQKNNLSYFMGLDFLIVGAGLFGSTFASHASKEGKKCLVIDKRNHIGGNIYCKEMDGINVHWYGAHIFHTSNKDVWDFVNSIVPFNRFTNSPIANYKGRLFNLPFNMNTFHQMWGVISPEEAEKKIEEQRREAVEKLNGKSPSNLEEQALTLVGKDIYETLIRDYTQKQWGRKCSELPAFIIRRLPVRLIYDNNYFNDLYQGIPIGGYNKLIEGLLHGCEVRLNTDFRDIKENWRDIADKLVYTGPIDEYFDFKLGRLDWRTVRFETEVLPSPNYQGNAVVNYTDAETPYTRIIEHKHFEIFGNAVYDNPKTVISKEFSTEYKPGMEPYYPINDEKNENLANEYREMAMKEKNVIFGGRLADYRYYDMAPVIEKAFEAWKNNCQ